MCAEACGAVEDRPGAFLLLFTGFTGFLCITRIYTPVWGPPLTYTALEGSAFARCAVTTFRTNSTSFTKQQNETKTSAAVRPPIFAGVNSGMYSSPLA